ncbi:hypothetical protein IWW39_004199 [Coemansia spiralis]|uniref:Uncharacterized protein n=1 Tax=Coemansia spiralis TaxID=417178 RepID=A0A9W8L3K1_9FUNG|nr:hypothetical protein IWW39_004199 [Coemansia spiralis]
MHRFSYLVVAALLSVAAVTHADGDYSRNNYATSAAYDSSPANDYATSSANDYAQNDYDNSPANDYAQDDYSQDDYAQNDYAPPVVTPFVQTVIQDVVNTVVEFSTVVVQQTRIQSVTQQVTNVQVASVAVEQEAVFQVTQTSICPPPPTATVDVVNTVWITVTATPTVQVFETRVQPQVVVQPVTLTQQVEQVAVETQVVNLQATAFSTSINNVVQVVQEDVAAVPVAPAPTLALAPAAY